MMNNTDEFRNKYRLRVAVLIILLPFLIIIPAMLLQERESLPSILYTGKQLSLFSPVFFVFLAFIFLLYFAVGRKHSGKQWIVLLFASWLFYASAGLMMLIPILITSIATWGAALMMERISDNCKEMTRGLKRKEAAPYKDQAKRRKKTLAIIVTVLNVGILAVFKYSNFILENVGAAAHREITAIDFLVPLGLSFYTFQSIGYLVDIYRGKYRADRNFFQFALFVSFFPQIIQGPISRHDQLAGQLFEGHKFDRTRLKTAIERMLWGYFKKMVIADRMTVVVDTVFADFTGVGVSHYTGFTVFIAVLFYGIQMYADFSGGIDIIIGVAEIFGIDMVENFQRPFMAKSVSDFWRRWHITLGNWMKDYVFYPLALSKLAANMSRKLKKSTGAYFAKVFPTCLASVLVFLLIGIWHGANWKYVIYGAYQAFFVSTGTLFEPFYRKCRAAFHVHPERWGYQLFQILRTIFLITIGRYFSRADTAGQAFAMLKATFTHFNPWVLFDGSLLNTGLDRKNFQFMLFTIVLLFVVDILQERGYKIREVIARRNVVVRWIIYFAAFFAILIFGMYGSGYDAASFIYQSV